MDYAEFTKLLGGGWYSRVNVYCQMDGCSIVENLIKHSALKNFRRNENKFKCRRCSFTEEGKERCSKATSYKRSDKTKKLMSESKKEFYKTKKGLDNKKLLSKYAAKQHGDNKINKSKRKILYISAKNNDIRVCNSSYEFVACEDFWEKDDKIKSYETQVSFEVEGRSHSLDALLEYHDESKTLIEIKPKKRVSEFKQQIQDCKKYADSMGCKFELWTEKRLFIFKMKEARDRADAYRKEHYLIDYAAYRQQKNRDRANRHYHKTNDKILIACNFCNIYHVRRKKGVEININKNGRYICINENGVIIGKMPKKKKVNPYEESGMKQCLGKCARILPFDCFSKGKATCKECRAEIYKAKYQNRKKDD